MTQVFFLENGEKPTLVMFELDGINDIRRKSQ